jgi:hypothetical protein
LDRARLTGWPRSPETLDSGCFRKKWQLQRKPKLGEPQIGTFNYFTVDPLVKVHGLSSDILEYLRGGGYRDKAIRVDDAWRLIGFGKLIGFHAWIDEFAIERDGAGEHYEERDA